jgi:lipoyl(octanoyl) transferase
MSHKVINLPGLISYQEGLDIQKHLFDLVETNKYDGFLVILEHRPVLTMGIRTDIQNLLVTKDYLDSQGIELYETDRGGDITFHGPGQIVAYPIVRYRELGFRLSDYMHALETVIINTINEQGIKAYSKSEFPGVWVDNTKICAIGVRAKKYITTHGLAFNVTTDLSYFNVINPCGITEYQVSKLEDFLPNPDIEVLKNTIIKNFEQIFDVRFEEETLDNILVKHSEK